MLNKFYQSLTEKSALKILSLSVVTYFFIFFAWCCLKYFSFAYYDFDLAVHDQVVWNIGQGSAYSSILGVNFLGNHIHFISFPIALIYKIFNHPLTLLLLQTLALALAAFPLYKMAKLVLGYRLALAVGIIYLLYPGLGYTNLFEFHPTAFATFFLMWMFYYYFQEKLVLFILSMFLSMFCQENIPLVVVFLGIYGLCTGRNKRFAVIPLVCGAVYFIVCTKVLLPHFNPNTIQFMLIYESLGNSLQDILVTAVTDPLKIFHIVARPEKLLYLKDIFVPLSFVPLFSPSSLLLSLPLFAQHLLSSRPSESSFFFHYTAELIPPLFVAFINGIVWIRKTGFLKNRENFLAQILFIVALMMNLGFGPHFGLISKWKGLMPDYRDGQKAYLVGKIPNDASVVATFEFLPHLSHRKDLYSFHHVYSGLFTLSNKPYQLPDNVQYALINFNDTLTFEGFYRPNGFIKISEFLKRDQWGVLDVRDNIVLFKKGIKDRYPLFTQVDGSVYPVNPVVTNIDTRFQLYGYDVYQRPELIHLVLYWKCLRETQNDINVFVDFLDSNGENIHTQRRPLCYRILPTQAWNKGQLIQEHQYISIPDEMRGRFKRIAIRFYDHRTNKVLMKDSKNPLDSVEIKLTD